MEPDLVLAKVATYAPAEVETIANTLAAVTTLVADGTPSFAGIVAQPIDVLEILASWYTPPPLLEAALWSCALLAPDAQRLSLPLCEKYRQVAFQAANLYGLLTECRQFPELRRDYDRFFQKLWLPGLTAPFSLLVALFLATIRTGAQIGTTPDKQLLAAQAEEIVVQIAQRRLGLWVARRDLLDLVFQCRDPEGFRQAQDYVASIHTLDRLIEQVQEKVLQACADYAIDQVEIVPEVARPYKVAKVRACKTDLQPNDLVRFIAILPDEPACDRFVSALHRVGNPRATYRDFMRHPKSNGYRSLHSRIHILALGSAEFFIRTPTMHEQSMYGKLFHWRRGVDDLDELTPSCPENCITIYTNSGESRILPVRSSVAAYVETEYHSHAREYVFTKARINGKVSLVGLDHALENGDIVEVIREERFEPPRALAPDRKAGSTGHPHAAHAKNNQADHAAQDRIARIKEEADLVEAAVAISRELSEGARSLSFCRNCRPFPPEDIVAYITTDGSVTIHTRTCSAIKDMALTEKVNWRRSTTRVSSMTLLIDGWDRVGLMADVANIISLYDVNMTKVEVEAQTNGTSHFKIDLHLNDPSVVESIRQKLLDDTHIVQVNISSVAHTDSPAHGPQSRHNAFANPYSTRPAEAEVFFGRVEERQQLWRELEQWHATPLLLLWGPKRIGKTSMLDRVERDANLRHGSEWVAVHLTLETWASAYPNLVNWFVVQLRDELNKQSRKQDAFVAHSAYDPAQIDPAAGLLATLEMVAHMVRPRRLLVLLDEFQYVADLETPKIHAFLAGLQQLALDAGNTSFILSASGLLRTHEQFQILRPLLNESSSSRIKLDTLDRTAAQDLVRKPVLAYNLTYDEKLLQKLLTLTEGHPYYINLLCHDMFEYAESILRERRGYLLTSSDLDKAVRKLLVQDNGVFDHLYEAIPDSKVVLAAMTRIAPGDGEYVSLRVLLKQVARVLDQDHATKIVEDLADLEVLARRADDVTEAQSYKIRLPLFQRWIEANWKGWTTGSA